MPKRKKKKVTREEVKAALDKFLSSGGIIKKLPEERVIYTLPVFINDLTIGNKSTSIRMQP